jgi:hypothetical protein
MAQIVGRRVSGAAVYNNNTCNGSVDQGNLHSFQYGGFLGIGKKTHNQAMYVSNGAIGQDG